MMQTLPEFLALVNDVLQAVIVIFGSAVVLYNLGRWLRAPVIRAFCALISFVVVVYLAELLVSRTIVSDSVEAWLHVEWVSIALVPAALYQLSDALLSTTGTTPKRRRYFVPATYLISLAFTGMILGTDWIAGSIVRQTTAPHLRAGPLFPLFSAYFWLTTAVSIYNVWRARQRSITSATRQRLTTTLLAFLAAPLAVFPYLALSSSSAQEVPIVLWIILIIGNVIVGLMFALLTAHLIYFGAASPDRVVRVRLYKFMARVPLAGSFVLLAYVLVSRSSPILGLPTETSLGFTLVATVMLVEWIIHAYKQPLERLFQLNDDPDVRRIQKLSERVLTTSDLKQFLEIVLAAACETLRTPTAFVAAITDEGPRLEAVIGSLTDSDSILQEADWRELSQPADNGNGETAKLETIDDFIVWQNYWIRPIYNQNEELMLGIFGIRARAGEPDLNQAEVQVLEKLLQQTADALEDRILQQEVFAAVEGLLPEITALQERRSAATLGGLPALTAKNDPLMDDPDEFKELVRDALSHYWGGPKLTKSPLMRLKIVQRALEEHQNNPTNALRSILGKAIELQKPEGERSLTTAEWILYNILEMKFVQGRRVRDVARRLAMSESDLYRKQRVAIENVARTIATLEQSVREEHDQPEAEGIG